MTEHVILDAGGVICLPRMGSWLTTVRFGEIVGPTRLSAVTPEEIAAAMEAASAVYGDESLPIPDETVEFAVRRNYFLDLSKRLSWTLTDQEADALARDMTENDARYDFYDDTRAGIENLRQTRAVYLLSNAMPSLRRVLRNAGLLELFDDALISTDVGSAKPDPVIYRTLLARNELEPGDCCFVDDRIDNLEAARALGMRTIHMARGVDSPWPEAVGDLFELARML